MAISETHYRLLCELHAKGVLPQGRRILEVGEANFYGDFDAREIPGIHRESSPEEAFGIVRQIYRNLFAPTKVVAIDAHGPTALKLDLNTLQGPPGKFGVVFNHGTAEHIFNIANVFRLMHDAAESGGLMIHESPFTGWIDHGFYCLQPTLFWDVAAANGYEVVLFAMEHLASKTYWHVSSREEIHEAKRRDQLADNLMLFVVLRKTRDEPFRVPMQGVYAGTTSEAAAKAWRDLR